MKERGEFNMEVENDNWEKSVEAVQKKLDSMIPDDAEPQSLAEALKQHYKTNAQNVKDQDEIANALKNLADSKKKGKQE